MGGRRCRVGRCDGDGLGTGSNVGLGICGAEITLRGVFVEEVGGGGSLGVRSGVVGEDVLSRVLWGVRTGGT